MTKINFLHIGKTAGTAIIQAIHEFPPNRDITVHPHGIRLSDIPRGEKVFFVLRDPADRFVSGFYSRQRRGMPRYNSPWTGEEEIAFAAFSSANSLGEALSSTEVERKNSAKHAMRVIGHVRNSFYDWFDSEDYFLERLDDILFVGMIEHLSAEFDMLKRLIGLPAAAFLPNDDLRAHRNPANFDRKLSSLAIENLRRWFSKDYDFYRLCNRIRSERGQVFP